MSRVKPERLVQTPLQQQIRSVIVLQVRIFRREFHRPLKVLPGDRITKNGRNGLTALLAAANATNDEQLAWARDLPLPVATSDEPIELLYWVGCAGSFSPEWQVVSRAMVKILDHVAELIVDNPQMQEICGRLSDLALLDYFNVIGGSAETLAGDAAAVPNMSFKLGVFAHLSASIRQVVDVPVMVILLPIIKSADLLGRP